VTFELLLVLVGSALVLTGSAFRWLGRER